MVLVITLLLELLLNENETLLGSIDSDEEMDMWSEEDEDTVIVSLLLIDILRGT